MGSRWCLRLFDVRESTCLFSSSLVSWLLDAFTLLALALSAGLTASVFVDLGEKHVVHDPDGEQPLRGLIVQVTQVRLRLLSCAMP